MKLSALLAPLIAAKASHATIMEVVLAFEAEQGGTVEASREKARARWHKWNDKRLQTLANVSNPLVRGEGSSSKEELSGKEKKKERATRLPKDWVIPDDWYQEACDAGLRPDLVAVEARKMHNWSLSAKDGAKLDWLATWRNWFQRALEAIAKATSPPDKPKKVTVASMWRDEGRKLGILPNEPPLEIDRRLGASLGDGSASSTNLARRFTGT